MGDGRFVRSILSVYATYSRFVYYRGGDVARHGCVKVSAPSKTGLRI